MTRGIWHHGNNSRSIYRYIHAEHENHMGLCDFLPEDGDLCLCMHPAGDCFDDYIVIRVNDDGLYHKVDRFGAYCFGEVFCTVPDRAFYLLLAGRPIALELEIIRGGK